MRILVVHGRYRSSAPSGENHVVDQEAAALAAAGHEVVLFERDSDDIENWSIARKIALPAKTLYNPEVRRSLTAELARTKPDVVHVHNTFPLLTPSVLHACRDAHVPVVATIHNYKLLCAGGALIREDQTCHKCLDGRGLPAAVHGCYRGSTMKTIPVVTGMKLNRRNWQTLVSAYIFISSAQRELMRGLGLPTERVFVKHNFVPEPPARTTAAEHLVTYLGRLDAAKGAMFLMDAWDDFLASSPDTTLRLAVAGGGPLADKVGAWAAARPSVDFHGLLPRDQASQLLGRSLAALVPSRWEETFGLVAVEAMAIGVAPVAPDRGSFPELISDGKDGVLYSPDSRQDLVRVLSEVDRDPAAFQEMGIRGARTYQARFTRDNNIAALTEIYQFAIRNPVARSPA